MNKSPQYKQQSKVFTKTWKVAITAAIYSQEKPIK